MNNCFSTQLVQFPRCCISVNSLNFKDFYQLRKKIMKMFIQKLIEFQSSSLLKSICLHFLSSTFSSLKSSGILPIDIFFITNPILTVSEQLKINILHQKMKMWITFSIFKKCF